MKICTSSMKCIWKISIEKVFFFIISFNFIVIKFYFLTYLITKIIIYNVNQVSISVIFQEVVHPFDSDMLLLYFFTKIDILCFVTFHYYFTVSSTTELFVIFCGSTNKWIIILWHKNVCWLFVNVRYKKFFITLCKTFI